MTTQGMKEHFSLVVDGKVVEARLGESLLEVARASGATIPTLCHHAGLESHGGCRLCMVEIGRKSWGDWTKLVASCEYPAEEGLVVQTASPKVQRTRRTVVDLLAARCPDTPFVQALARAHGLMETSYVPRKKADDCILCAICTRTCEAVGADAIATSGRGVDKEITLPFTTDASACIGCLACALNCPTGHIKYEADAQHRRIWGRDFEVVRCACGAPLGTPEQIDHVAAKKGIPRSYFAKCDACRKRETAEAFARVVS